MENHILGEGQGQNAAGGREDPAPTGTSSMAVRQFASLAFRWTPVHKPANPFRVETVTVEERYCLACFGARHFDVIRGAGREAAICQCCGAEVQ